MGWLRRLAKKWLYNRLPFTSGRYPYFGTIIRFPTNTSVIDTLADSGIYEDTITNAIANLLPQEPCVYFDVGANLGLMSVPFLALRQQLSVVSFEPSPTNFPWISKAQKGSPYCDRWVIIPKAVSKARGSARFSLSANGKSDYDGLRFTERVNKLEEVEVELTTLDFEWLALGSPRVGCIKMDIEGGELDALVGAEKLIASERPPIVTEWYEPNFSVYGCSHADLIKWAKHSHYQIFGMPEYFEITSVRQLALSAARTGYFLLLPRTDI